MDNASRKIIDSINKNTSLKKEGSKESLTPGEGRKAVSLLGSILVAGESFDSANGAAPTARGYILPSSNNSQPFSKEDEITGLDISSKEKQNKTPYNDLKTLMVELSDGLDESGEVALANFGDFLIKKIAEMEKVDYVYQFNLLIKTINNSDILNKDKKISELVLEFNNYILKYSHELGESTAKMNAYQSARKEVSGYVK